MDMMTRKPSGRLPRLSGIKIRHEEYHFPNTLNAIIDSYNSSAQNAVSESHNSLPQLIF